MCQLWRGFTYGILLNVFVNNKILDSTKLKAFADDKIDWAGMRMSVSDKIEIIVEKGENAGFFVSHNVIKLDLTF